MSKEAMKQALEALEIGWSPTYVNGVDAREKGMKAIKSLRQAIAEAEKQEQGEPVAWMCHPFGDDECEFSDHQECENCIPLYTTPPQSKEPEQEPVAWMFQHEETGRIMFVEAQQLEWGFEKGNPRLEKIGPVYTTPQQRNPLTDAEFAYVWHHQTGRIMGTDKNLLLQAKQITEAAHGIKGEA